jgi:head-tail adaptor
MNMGKDIIGKNKPHRKIIGKRKKLENVWASNTSLDDTAIKSPKSVDTIAIRIIAGTTKIQAIPERSARKAAISTGTKALTIPKRIAPEVLASIRSSSDIGASSNLSKERLRLSNVIVTDKTDVVPKRMEIVITPGNRDRTPSSPLPDLIKNMPVQTIGNIMPQEMLGGFR